MMGGKDGFSLLEMLVALALLVGISMLATTGLQYVQKIYVLSSNNRNLAFEASAREKFRHIMEAGAHISSVEKASASEFIFRADILYGADFFRNARVRIHLESDKLQFTMEPSLEETRTKLPPKTLVLANGVNSHSIEYFSNTTGRWGPQIAQHQKIPLLIRISTADDDDMQWAPITISPGLELRQREISASSLFPPG